MAKHFCCNGGGGGGGHVEREDKINDSMRRWGKRGKRGHRGERREIFDKLLYIFLYFVCNLDLQPKIGGQLA